MNYVVIYYDGNDVKCALIKGTITNIMAEYGTGINTVTAIVEVNPAATAMTVNTDVETGSLFITNNRLEDGSSSGDNMVIFQEDV